MTLSEAMALRINQAVWHPAWTRAMHVERNTAAALWLAEPNSKTATMCIRYDESWGRRIVALLSLTPTPGRTK